MSQLKQLMLKEKLLSEKDIDTALKQVAKEKTSIMQVIENMASIDEVKLLSFFSTYFGLPTIKLEEKDLTEEILQLVPAKIAKKYRVIPIERIGNNLILATGNPHNLEALDIVRFKIGFFPKPVLASEARIDEALEKYYGGISYSEISEIKYKKDEFISDSRERTVITASEDQEDAPIIKLVNEVIVQCLSRGASDIHIEPYEDFLRIRLRIDGSLQEIVRPPEGIKNALISRVKIMSGLNIAETRLPQDGAINIKIGDKPIDFRVSSLPTTYGEKIVMRILDKANLQVDMTKLGMEKKQLALFQKAIKKPHGIILVTGPTGSGKTTTLYSAMQELNQEDVNIMTAEDPVEYNLPGINQSQMKSSIGLNFSAALRAFLRQDPDIIMVGEIRDLETAEIAIKAALTGHLVLSTLHTNNAPDTISRLLNMGIASFNLVASLNCVTAQRLAKMICKKCKELDPDITPELLEKTGLPKSYVQEAKVYRGKGCPACSKSGYKGRVAVHEMLFMNDPVKRSILQGDSTLDLKKVGMKNGMTTLRQSCLIKMLQGLISFEEVLKVSSADDD